MDRQAIEELTMPITYGRHLQRLFDPEALLKGTGIATQELQKPDQKITVKQALRYVSNAIKIAPEPSWYLEWAHSIADHFHGPISIALLSAPTLGAGLDTFSRFFPSRIPYMHIDSHVADRFFHLEFLQKAFIIINIFIKLYNTFYNWSNVKQSTQIFKYIYLSTDLANIFLIY